MASSPNEKQTIASDPSEAQKHMTTKIHEKIEEKVAGKEDPIAGALAGIGRTFARALAGLNRATIAGTFAGMAEEFSGYPFDTVKTKMQVSTKSVTALEVLRSTLKQDGFSGLFKGILPPFAAAAGINALLFGGFGTTVDYISKQKGFDPDAHHHHKKEGEAAASEGGSGHGGGVAVANLTLSEIAVAGAVAGLAQSFVVCPVDIFKIRLQVAGMGHGGGAHGADHPKVSIPSIAKDLLRTRSFFTGLLPTLIRDVPGYAAFFATYEGIKRGLSANFGKTEEELGFLGIVVSGGLAGAALHSITYPADVVKSLIQLSPEKYTGTLDCFKQTLKAGGVRGLFVGAVPTIIRSFPANAAGFAAYEFTMKLI